MVRLQKRGYEMVMGYRQALYVKCYPVAQLLVFSVQHSWKRRFRRTQGEDMRELWECGKSGNLAVRLLREALQLPDGDPVDARYIHAMFKMPGFLTKEEQRATKAIRGKSIEVWRGCALAEHERKAYGFSWTSDEYIASWFASGYPIGTAVVLHAHVAGDDCYVLHTCESEIVVLGDVAVQEVTPCTWECFYVLWKQQTTVPPRVVA